MSTDWYWEGNVVNTVVTHLQREGWTIRQIANTATREAGIDVYAIKPSRTLLVEVKGYPSTVYQRGEKIGQPQAHHTSNPSPTLVWRGPPISDSAASRTSNRRSSHRTSRLSGLH
jgi:hypothetical protein